MSNKECSKNIKRWPKLDVEEISSENLKKYRKLISIPEKFEVDESTGKDLNLEEFFRNSNRCYSTIGSQVYFDLLHKPKVNKIDIARRRKQIEEIRQDSEFRNQLISAFTELGYTKYSDPLDILFLKYRVNLKAVVVSLLLLVSMIFLTIMYFFTGNKEFLLYLLVVFGIGNLAVNMLKGTKSVNSVSGIRGKFLVNSTEDGDMKSFLALTNVIRCGLKLTKISKNTEIFDEIDDKTYSRSKKFMDSVTAYAVGQSNPIINMIVELLFLKFLLYQTAIKSLSTYREDLINILRYTGEMDALLGIATYRQELLNDMKVISEAEHLERKKYFEIEEGVHPLIEKCVANSIVLDDNGIILTGSNMSGKSTFMRTIGLNALFSQVTGFAFAKRYRASVFSISSALVSSDDIMTGKSYFMDEAEGVLRLIKNIDEDITSLILIDEIFRGTNPIERVSASASIIDHIQRDNALCIVATHDKDIIFLAKENFHNYHFEEIVDGGNLKFDYKLRNGIAGSTNALKILDAIGYPKEIVDRARKIVSENKELKDYRVIN